MKNLFTGVLCLLFCCSVSAQPRTSWPMINGDAQHSSYAQINLQFPLEVTATYDIGYNAESGMAVSGDMVYIADVAQDSNRVWAANLETGTTLWSFPVPLTGGGMSFIPAVAEGVVLAGGQKGRGLYGLDALTGDSLWLLPVLSLYSRSPVIREGRVYQISSDSLSCVDLHTGGVYWSFVESMPQISPAVDDDLVYFASRQQFYALDRISGDTAWVNDSVSVGTFMSISLDSQFVFTGERREIAACDKTTGEVAWIINLEMDELMVDWPGAFAVTPEYLVVKYMHDTIPGNHFLILDKNTGAEVNRFTGLSTFSYSSPTVINGYVVDCYSDMIFLDINTGQLVYEIKDLPVTGSPTQVVAADNKIYIAAQGPQLIVLEQMLSGIRNEHAEIPVTLFPNPIKDGADLTFSLDRATQIRWSILDTHGSIVSTTHPVLYPSGSYQIKIETRTLLPGVYTLHFQTEYGSATRRFVRSD